MVAVSSPERIISADALPPRARLSASMMIDFPRPGLAGEHVQPLVEMRVTHR